MVVCFVYGTLMAEEVLARVVFGTRTLQGTSIKTMPATLHGYRRYRLKERDYPGVASSVEDKVEGKLVFNLDSSAIQKLDDFEGSEYARKEIRAIGADGETYSASVYIFLDTHLLEKDAGEWRLDEFVTHKMHNWIADELGDQQGLGGRFWDAQQVPIT